MNDDYIVSNKIIPALTTLLVKAPRIANGLWKRQDSKLHNIPLPDIIIGKKYNYRRGKRLYSIRKIDNEFFQVIYNSEIPMEGKVETILIKELMRRVDVV